MPEFILDTSGAVRETRDNPPRFYPSPCLWADLDAFTQGYIEALFFTNSAPGYTLDQVADDLTAYEAVVLDGGTIPEDAGFADLAPETLAKIIDDCVKFQIGGPFKSFIAASIAGAAILERGSTDIETEAGRDFWYTRNGHGCGFWDGDWPEPYAAQLTEAAKAFREVDAYLGDDSKVYLS